MKCALAQEWISEYLDGELGVKPQAELKAHLEACPDCRALARDFEEIVRRAKSLGLPEPSPSVWPKIAAVVRQSRREMPVPRPAKGRRLGIFWARPAWRYAAAAALVLTIGGAVIIRQKPWSPAGPDRGDPAAYTLAKLQEAQGYYEKAIRSLNEAVQSQDNSLAPELAEIFRRSLAAMDETILACRQIVEKDPNNLTARAFLLTAYREKVDMLEEMMGLERFSVREKAETAL